MKQKFICYIDNVHSHDRECSDERVEGIDLICSFRWITFEQQTLNREQQSHQTRSNTEQQSHPSENSDNAKGTDHWTELHSELYQQRGLVALFGHALFYSFDEHTCCNCTSYPAREEECRRYRPEWNLPLYRMKLRVGILNAVIFWEQESNLIADLE